MAARTTPADAMAAELREIIRHAGALVALLLALPPQARLWLAAGGGALLLLLGACALVVLRRRLARLPLAFSQSVAELKKDRACF